MPCYARATWRRKSAPMRQWTAVLLSIVAGLIALGEWLIFLPLAAMGSVEEGYLYRAAVGFGSIALPAAALCDFASARRLASRGGSARRLLAVSTVLQLLVEGSVAFPLFIGGVVTLAAATLAGRQPAATTVPSP